MTDFFEELCAHGLVTKRARAVKPKTPKLTMPQRMRVLLASFDTALAHAKRTNNSRAIVSDLLLAIFVSYSRASDWTQIYSTFVQGGQRHSMFHSVTDGVNMNAHALRIWGHMIVYTVCAQQSPGLFALHKCRGSIFDSRNLANKPEWWRQVSKQMHGVLPECLELARTLRGKAPKLFAALDSQLFTQDSRSSTIKLCRKKDFARMVREISRAIKRPIIE